MALYINGLHCGHVKQFAIDSSEASKSDGPMPACEHSLEIKLTELDKLWFDRPVHY